MGPVSLKRGIYVRRLSSDDARENTVVPLLDVFIIAVTVKQCQEHV